MTSDLHERNGADCGELRPYLEPYAEGTLRSSALLASLRAHLDRCADCRRELARLDRLTALFLEEAGALASGDGAGPDGHAADSLERILASLQVATAPSSARHAPSPRLLAAGRSEGPAAKSRVSTSRWGIGAPGPTPGVSVVSLGGDRRQRLLRALSWAAAILLFVGGAAAFMSRAIAPRTGVERSRVAAAPRASRRGAELKPQTLEVADPSVRWRFDALAVEPLEGGSHRRGGLSLYAYPGAAAGSPLDRPLWIVNAGVGAKMRSAPRARYVVIPRGASEEPFEIHPYAWTTDPVARVERPVVGRGLRDCRVVIFYPDGIHDGPPPQELGATSESLPWLERVQLYLEPATVPAREPGLPSQW